MVANPKYGRVTKSDDGHEEVIDYENLVLDQRSFDLIVKGSHSKSEHQVILVVDVKDKSYIYGEVSPNGRGFYSHHLGGNWIRRPLGTNLWKDSQRGSFIESFAFIEATLNQILMVSICNYSVATSRSTFYEYLERTDITQKIIVLRKQKIIANKDCENIEKLAKVRNKLAHRITRDIREISDGTGPELYEGMIVSQVYDLMERVADALARAYGKLQAPYLSWLIDENVDE